MGQSIELKIAITTRAKGWQQMALREILTAMDTEQRAQNKKPRDGGVSA
jgi:hypothetical protein